MDARRLACLLSASALAAFLPFGAGAVGLNDDMGPSDGMSFERAEEAERAAEEARQRGLEDAERDLEDAEHALHRGRHRHITKQQLRDERDQARERLRRLEERNARGFVPAGRTPGAVDQNSTMAAPGGIPVYEYRTPYPPRHPH